MARDLQQLVWSDLGGLWTKFDPERRPPNSLRVAENADSYARWQAYGKVPGSSIQSQYAGAPWEDLRQYEFFDLEGELQRRRVGVAGGRFYEIQSDKSLVGRKSGLTNERLASFTAFDRIHLCSKRNDPFKYDGVHATRWGVKAPGTEEFSIEGFDDHTDWTASADASLSAGTSDQDLGGSTAIAKTGTTSDVAYLEQTYGAAKDVSQQSNLAFVWLFVPPGESRFLALSSAAFEFWLGSDASNVRKWTWVRSELLDGWNLLSFRLDAPDDTLGSPADLSSTVYLRALLRVQASAFTFGAYQIDHFHVSDVGAPTLALGGAGGVTGTVAYRITYVSQYGHESNAGLPSAAVTADSGGSEIVLSGIPLSPDPQVVARRIYRDLDGDAIYQLVTEIQDNTTTTYTDSVSLGSLSVDTPPLAGDDLDDNSPPPRLSDVVYWRGYFFGIDAASPFQIIVGDVNEPESAPFVNRFTFDSDLVAIRRHRLGVVAIGTDRVFGLSGSTPVDFRWDALHPETGSSARDATLVAHTSIVVWHDDGPYIHDGANPWYIGNAIRDIVESMDASLFLTAHGQHHRSRYQLVWFFSDGTVLIYSYGAGSGVVSPEGYGIDPQDLRVGGWSKIILPTAYAPRCSAIIETDTEVPELWVGGADGYVYRIFDPAETSWKVGTSSEEGVACVLEGSWQPFRGEAERTPYGYLRDAIVDVTGEARFLHVTGYAETETTWAFTVYVDDTPDPSTPKRSTTVDVTIGPGQTSYAYSLDPNQNMTGIWASWRADNSDPEEGGRISSVRITYLPGGFQGERRPA